MFLHYSLKALSVVGLIDFHFVVGKRVDAFSFVEGSGHATHLCSGGLAVSSYPIFGRETRHHFDGSLAMSHPVLKVSFVKGVFSILYFSISVFQPLAIEGPPVFGAIFVDFDDSRFKELPPFLHVLILTFIVGLKAIHFFFKFTVDLA
jgi:hypothetical protein